MTETLKEAESGAALSVATHSENIVRISLLIIRFFHVLYSDRVLNAINYTSNNAVGKAKRTRNADL
jgi:hypothetical protein